MFKLFRKKKDRGSDIGKPSKVATKINALVWKLQTRFAVTMSSYEQRLNHRQRKLALTVFCLVMCSLSSYWLYQGIFGQPNSDADYLKHQTITPLQDISLPDSLNTEMLEDFKRRLELQKAKTDSTKQ